MWSETFKEEYNLNNYLKNEIFLYIFALNVFLKYSTKTDYCYHLK